MITRDDIIKMAWEAGISRSSNPDLWDVWEVSDTELESVAHAAYEAGAAAEREACAKVCDTEADQHASLDRNGRSRHLDDATVARTCAAAIRARKAK